MENFKWILLNASHSGDVLSTGALPALENSFFKANIQVLFARKRNYSWNFEKRMYCDMISTEIRLL